jgi:hypothetical protein
MLDLLASDQLAWLLEEHTEQFERLSADPARSRFEGYTNDHASQHRGMGERRLLGGSVRLGRSLETRRRLGDAMG